MHYGIFISKVLIWQEQEKRVSKKETEVIWLKISKEFKKRTYTEGDSQSEWLLIDVAGTVMVHLMKKKVID